MKRVARKRQRKKWAQLRALNHHSVEHAGKTQSQVGIALLEEGAKEKLNCFGGAGAVSEVDVWMKLTPRIPILLMLKQATEA